MVKYRGLLGIKSIENGRVKVINPMEMSMKKVFKQCINKFSIEKCPDQVIGTCKIDTDGFSFINNWISKDDRKNNEGNCNINNRQHSYKDILIILESPHKDEYKDKGFIAPALGKTGINLKNKLESKINKYIKYRSLPEGEYNLVLVNAIQYPTSLGFTTSNFRDRIWLDLWIVNDLRNKLIDRIREYDPKIIINLCTNGEHKENPFVYDENPKDITKKFLYDIFKDDKNFKIEKDKIYYEEKCIYNDNSGNLTNIRLKMFVQNAIEEYTKNSNITCLIGTHPSSWSENDESKLKYI